MSNLIRVFPRLIEGMWTTIGVTSAAVLIGIVIGLIMALWKMSSNRFLKVLATIYIEALRGTPLFVQILFFYFGIPGLIISLTGHAFHIEAITAGILVCGMNSGAYIAEIIRAGIQSIDKGQIEAGRSLGLSHKQAMRHVILPQAFKVVLPPLGNEFITLIKETSILSVIGVIELTMQGQLHAARTAISFSTYLGVALVYLVLTLSISKLVNLMERRLGVSDRSA